MCAVQVVSVSVKCSGYVFGLQHFLCVCVLWCVCVCVCVCVSGCFLSQWNRPVAVRVTFFKRDSAS